MVTIKAFYNNLDILNLILFGGTIIVVILIIIFLILYFSRKKSLDNESKGNIEYEFGDINIIKSDKDNINIQNKINSDIDIIKNDNSNFRIQTISDDDLEKVNREINLDDDTLEIPIKVKKVETKIEQPTNIINTTNATIEKQVTKPTIEYRNITIEKPTIEPKVEEHNYNIVVENKKDDGIRFEELVKKDNDEKPKAYQKNVFREMNSRNQTSPIGIVYEKNVNEIEEYKESLNDKKDNYLENVYTSLSEAKVPDKIELTEYEKKQEEDAVISYQELIKKKDTIDYDKEEDAVISYGELLNRGSRLYNITEEEKDKEFLSELKEFRKDL